MKVYKHALEWGDTHIKMTGDPIHFGIQDEQPTLWAEHHEEQPEREYHFKLIGTGHSVEGRCFHIGTVQHRGFVWHLYQMI